MAILQKVLRRLKHVNLVPLAIFTTCRIIFFLLKNRKAILKNRILYPFYCSSFGHNIISFELLTRFTYPHKASVIYTPWKRYNPHLSKLYSESIDLFYFNAPHSVQDFTWNMMRLGLTCISFSSRTPYKPVVYEYEGFCNLLSFGEKDIAGHEELGYLYEIRNTRGFSTLIKNQWGRAPQLPEDELQKCKRAIKAKYPDFFEKPLVTMLLRKKGADGLKLSDTQRCPLDMSDYIPAVQYFSNNGFHIAGTGETDDKLFSNITGYSDLSEIEVDSKLLNIFLLTECDLFFGQQSGPYYLPNSRGIQCVLTNCMPYRMGSLGEKDLNLYKKVMIKGEEVSVVEMYKNHIDLVRGYHFAEKEVILIDNKAEEILETVKESVEIFKGKYTPNKILELDQKLKSVMPEDIRAKKDQSRMPAFILESVQDEL